MDLECARQAHAEPAEPPADHCWVPSLTAVDIGEALHHLNCDCATRREAAMACPQAHSAGSDFLHAPHDEIQRLIPARAAPGIRAAVITNLGVQQSFRIAKNLVGAAAAHAKKTLTVWIVPITADSVQLAAFHFDQHSAKCWMAIHGTHSPHDFSIASGHSHLRLRHCRAMILPEMGRFPTKRIVHRGLLRCGISIQLMSQMGHEHPTTGSRIWSALPQTADILSAGQKISFGPQFRTFDASTLSKRRSAPTLVHIPRGALMPLHS